MTMSPHNTSYESEEQGIVLCIAPIFVPFDGGLSDAPHIPARFRSFWQIPVPFQWNLPTKISLLPRNFDMPVISPEQSLELTGMEWHWNPVHFSHPLQTDY